METFTIKSLAERLQALPAHVVYGQLTGREDWGKAMQTHLPSHMHDGFVWWIALGREDMLGGFMRAMLEGNLFGAYRKADSQNFANMENWVRFLVNYAPSDCFGSEARVRNWPGIIDQTL